MSLNGDNGHANSDGLFARSRLSIIRTSDRKTFKVCRRQWDFGSKIRQNWETDYESKFLTFGTAIHAALEVWYEPNTWNLHGSAVVEALALAAFYESYPQPKKASDDTYAIWQNDIELGKQMLSGYFMQSRVNDTFTPVYVEIEFEVPIIWNHDFDPPTGFEVYPNQNNAIEYLGEPVIYQGRIDMIVKDEYGKYWIWDHKTAASLGNTDHLEMDEQITSYIWAMQHMLGIKIEGFVYNELVKQVPHKPKVLKKGNLSQDKTQLTTHALYLEAIAENGLKLDDYAEFLAFIKENPKEFYRRTVVPRSQEELQSLGDNIALEAIDMLNNPSIYPNPSKFNCQYCDFRVPCLAMNEGSDVSWILSDGFHVRVSESEIATQ